MMATHEHTPQGEMNNQAIIADVQAVGEEALRIIAPERGVTFDEAHYQAACGPVTDIMVPELIRMGYDIPNPRGERHMAKVGWLYDQDGNPLPINEQPEDSEAVIHRFPVIDVDGTPENEVIADATWQQFLTPEQRTLDLPKVLAGTREQVQDFLIANGLTDKDLLEIWQKPFVPSKQVTN